MSKTTIPPKTIVQLWVMSGGRCEYEGCNKALWRDDLTLTKMNRGYIAHIVADSPGGPRGQEGLSEKLSKDISNLMLMCDKHHSLIDKEQVEEHPVERLKEMKRIHENRIEINTSIKEEKQSEVLLYGANIGSHSTSVDFQKAVLAMTPNKYPASAEGINLSMSNSSFEDKEDEFWKIESENLYRLFNERVKDRLSSGSIKHLSVFGFAPQPLLIQLGQLLSDINEVDIYQLHKEPISWAWQDHPESFWYEIDEPAEKHEKIALVLSLSATINDERITSVLGEDVSIWTITISQPNNDFLKSKEQLRQFRTTMRKLLDRIKSRHGENTPIHIFPSVPVSVALEIGRVWNPKSDLPFVVYDQNRNLGGFVKTLEFPYSQRRYEL